MYTRIVGLGQSDTLYTGFNDYWAIHPLEAFLLGEISSTPRIEPFSNIIILHRVKAAHQHLSTILHTVNNLDIGLV